MKKIISMILICTMICFNLSAVIYAEEKNDVLSKYKEYNFNKIALYLSLVELYKSGVGLDIGGSKDEYLEDGRKIETGREVELNNTKNTISWHAFYRDKKLTEEQLYDILELKEASKSAKKSNNTSHTMFYGGIIAFGIGFLMLSDLGMESDTTESELTMPGALLVAGGALAMVYGNKTSAIKDIDYVDMFKLVKKHNLKLLKSYFSDVDVDSSVNQLENINNLAELTEFVHKDLGETNENHYKKDFDDNMLRMGMTKKKVLTNFGSPYFIDEYNELSSWEYVRFYESKKLFDLGRFTGESYNYIIHTLYFRNNILVDWTKQKYTSE